MSEKGTDEIAAAFRLAQDASPDGYMLFASVRDHAGAVVDFSWLYTNPAAARIVARDPVDLRGRRLLEEMPGNREDGLFDAYRGVVESGEPWQHEFHYAHEGVNRWFRSTAVRVGDGFAVIFSDVTDRVRATEALREQNMLTSLIMENAETALFMMNEHGHCTYMNPAAERMTGFMLNELRDIPLHDAIHHRRPDGSPYPRSECPIDRALPEDSSIRAHADRFIRKDGSYFDVLCAASPLIRDGVPVGTVIEVRDVTERRQAEAERERLIVELRAERSRLEEAFRRAPTFLAVMRGADHEFVLANEAYLQLVGRRDIVGKALLEALPELRGQGFKDLLDQVLRSGEPYVGREVPVLVAREPGAPPEERFVDFTYLPFTEADGTRVGVIAHGADVTETVVRRRESERHAEDLQFLAEASRVLAGSLDRDSTLRALCDLVVPRLGDSCLIDLVDPEGEITRTAIHHSGPGGDDFADRYSRLPPPAGEHPVAVAIRTGETQRNDGFDPAGTDRPTDGEREREFFERLGIRSNITAPLWSGERIIGALTFCYTDANRRHGPREMALAMELARRAGETLENVRLHREALEARAEAQEKAVELELQAEELQVQTEELEQAQLEQEMANDELQGANTLLTLQRAESEAAREAADQANAAKSAFLATMSHELRTPINAVIGYAELLEAGIGGELSAKQQRYLERIRSSSAHLLTLVNEVLDLAQIEAGRTHVRRESAVLDGAVREAIALIEPQAERKRVELDVAFPEGPATRFVGDEDRVRQILVNLLSNAVKFTPAEGRISLRVRPDAEAPYHTDLAPDSRWVAVEIEDTGIGIAEDRQRAVFEPFTQGEEALTRATGGTGLGLTISRHLAHLMGGEITVRSRPGSGSVFTLWLPVSAPDEPTAELPWRVPLERIGEVREAGRALMVEAQPLVERVCERLRRDPETPLARTLTGNQLEDHIATFLTDLGKALEAVDDGGLLPLVRDSAEIQRVISELHGLQRAKLGWSRAALHREFAIVGEEVAAVARAAAGRELDPGDDPAAPRLLALLLEEAERSSLASWYRAHAAEPDGREADSGAAAS